MVKYSVVLVLILLYCFASSSTQSTGNQALGLCQATPLPTRLIRASVINVVYTMDSSCSMCVQQALRLPKLKRYFERKGVRAHFIVGVNNKTDSLTGLAPSTHVNTRRAWRALGMHSNRFYIIDRCGRLAFEVVQPWSNLDFPFVRAAILTAQQMHRCGLCPSDYSQVDEEVKIAEYPALDALKESIAESSSEEVIIRLRHSHRGDPNVYNYIIRTAGNPNYHRHHPSDKEIQRRFLSTTPTPTTQETEHYQDYEEETILDKHQGEIKSQDFSEKSTESRLPETSQTSINNNNGLREDMGEHNLNKTLNIHEKRINGTATEVATSLPIIKEDANSNAKSKTINNSKYDDDPPDIDKSERELKLVMDHIWPILDRINNTEDYLDY